MTVEVGKVKVISYSHVVYEVLGTKVRLDWVQEKNKF